MKYVIIYDSPVRGHNFVGPFKSVEEAILYGGSHIELGDYRITRIENVSTSKENP